MKIVPNGESAVAASPERNAEDSEEPPGPATRTKLARRTVSQTRNRVPDLSSPALSAETETDSSRHRNFPVEEFWRRIPAYRDVDRATFLDHNWQNRNAVINPARLRATVGDLLSDGFYADVERGLERVPMSVRIPPYIIAQIDWNDPEHDPLRRQYLPLDSALIPDHPRLTLDSLGEQNDAKAPGLTHRYNDKALFLALKTCPLYCRFCTRSYAVGLDTDRVKKVQLSAEFSRWQQAFDYIRATPQIEDIVISGGDTLMLKPEQIRLIGETLLDIPHVRRMRFATRGPAILPMKLLTDDLWFGALAHVVNLGRRQMKEVVVHTHFNHPNEATWITYLAMQRMFEAGITVRNQSVLLRGVNDDADTMRTLLKRLSYMNVHPYYVFQHDLVKGVEDLRTPVSRTIELEKQMRGSTAGFNTPTFVVDLPGGGGKRDVHSYEYYDPTTGVSVYRSPNIDAHRLYLYFDPIHLLPPEGRARWADPAQHETMVLEALSAAERNLLADSHLLALDARKA